MKIDTKEKDYYQCIAIKHEFLRCKDAYDEFEKILFSMALNKKTDKMKSYRAYNQYSYFILHLYEFLMAAYGRDEKDTNIFSSKKDIEKLDRLWNSEAERAITNKIAVIQNKKEMIPQDKKLLTYLYSLLPIPEEFGKNFRKHRNKIIGHASFERIQDINLTTFYKKYDVYLYFIYHSNNSFWGKIDNVEHIDLHDVTEFLNVVKIKDAFL